MRILTTFLPALFSLLSGTLSAQHYTCTSPDGRNVVTIEVGDSLRLSATRGSAVILRPSTIGLAIEGEGVYGAHATLRATTTREIDTLLRPEVRQKSATIRDHYRELTLEFTQPFSVAVRVFNEGMAYRFSTRLSGKRTVAAEIAQFAFPEESIVIIPEEESFQSHNERTYIRLPVGRIRPERFCSTPALVSVPGGKSVVITESDLDDYPGLWLAGDSLRHSLRAIFPHAPLRTEQKRDRDVVVKEAAPYLAITEGTRSFPWRVFVTADRDAALIESQLVYQLAQPCRLTTTAWIRPGKVAWDWWNDLNITGVDFVAGVNTATYKYYIDFAAAHGLQYVILDEGWYPLGNLLAVNPGIDVEEVIRYGKEKKVGVILWVVWKTLDDQLEPALTRFAKWGAAGVKVDFMQRDDQWMVNTYRRVARAAADHRLLVDFHGACKPTGLNREYPNVLTYEGVKGMEHSKWDTGASPENALVIPFVRGVAGPFDYTPGAMTNATRKDFRPVYSRPMSQGTRCQQLAMYVVFDSPLQMLADAPSAYLREPGALAFLSEVPTVWDETRGLDGVVSDYIAVARRSGGEWYVGAMTDWTERDVTLDFSFLPPGSWRAEVFQDGPNAHRNGNDFTRVWKGVESRERWVIHLAPGGGWVARISPDRSFPRDTSFTVESSAAKLKKSHPRAVAVSADLPPGVEAEEGIVYSTATGRALRLDLFRPAGRTSLVPAVLVIHGGGWASGDRSMEVPLAQRFAARGFVAAAVEYRLSPEAKYPAAIGDLRTAVRWLRAHAGRYGIDTLKIAACGGSAGGNLAVSLGMGRTGVPAVDESEWSGYSGHIQAVVDIDGPVDLTIQEERVKVDDPSKPSAVRRWLGFSYEERPDLWREVSPVFHVTAECAPIIFINSSIERFHAGRDRMIEQMSAFGIPSAVHTIPGTPHPFWLFHPWAEEATAHAVAFLHRIFGTEGPDPRRMAPGE